MAEPEKAERICGVCDPHHPEDDTCRTQDTDEVDKEVQAEDKKNKTYPAQFHPGEAGGL